MKIKPFLELKRNLKKDYSGLLSKQVFLCGDSSTQFIAQGLRASGWSDGLDLKIKEADFGQLDRLFSDAQSELFLSRPDVIVVIRTAQVIARRFYKTSLSERARFADDILQEIKGQLQTIVGRLPEARIIITNLCEIFDGIFGHYGNKTDLSLTFAIRSLNLGFMRLGREMPSVSICDVSSLATGIGLHGALDPRLQVDAEMMYSLDFVSAITTAMSGIVKSYAGMVRKCLVVDLDNTLWGGIIGDDGLDKIEIGDLGIGKAFTELQIWVKELGRRGIILAVCSKNDAQTAKEPFERHPDMVLTLDDFAIFVANWESKADNMVRIREFLNIGFDSMVFIDDNPFEREVIRKFHPDILVPELPEDPVEYVTFLRSLNLFETTAFTHEDEERNRHFAQEGARDVLFHSFANEEDFLRDLSLNCEVQPINKFNLPRAAQLLMRSNQFNLRTIRYSESDLLEIMASPDHVHWTFHLTDRLGKYGLISVIIGHRRGGTLFLDSWVMSCRVLKRGVEFFAMNEIIAYCRNNGIADVDAEYLPTKKNKLVERLLPDLGFVDLGEQRWSLKVDGFAPLSTQVRLKTAEQ